MSVVPVAGMVPPTTSAADHGHQEDRDSAAARPTGDARIHPRGDGERGDGVADRRLQDAQTSHSSGEGARNC